jgi:hypothetical protein
LSNPLDMSLQAWTLAAFSLQRNRSAIRRQKIEQLSNSQEFQHMMCWGE